MENDAREDDIAMHGMFTVTQVSSILDLIPSTRNNCYHVNRRTERSVLSNSLDDPTNFKLNLIMKKKYELIFCIFIYL